MVGVVGAGARRLRRAITAGHKPTRVRRDLDPLRANRGTRGRAAGARFRATPVALGSRLPRRKVFRPVPAAKWKPAISPTRLLHWSSCVGRGSHLAHTGCDSLPELLPGSRDHRSIATRDVSNRWLAILRIWNRRPRSCHRCATRDAAGCACVLGCLAGSHFDSPGCQEGSQVGANAPRRAAGRTRRARACRS